VCPGGCNQAEPPSLRLAAVAVAAASVAAYAAEVAAAYEAMVNIVAADEEGMEEAVVVVAAIGRPPDADTDEMESDSSGEEEA
jgi:hypothetical protein